MIFNKLHAQPLKECWMVLT